MQDLRFRI